MSKSQKVILEIYHEIFYQKLPFVTLEKEWEII